MEERLQDQRNREARQERARQELELRMQAVGKKRSKCKLLSLLESCLETEQHRLTFSLLASSDNCL
jgi:hypothetical protein